MTAPYWTDATCSLFLGDCLDVLAAMEPASVDAVVTDPPYGLEFMGREWDAPWRETGVNADAGFHGGGISATAKAPTFTGSTNPNCLNCGGKQRGRRDGTAIVAVCVCAEPVFPNVRAIEMRTYQDWCQQWAVECLRVLKPGGHLLAFGGTRTWHRLACGIEDAGFEIRDCTADLTGREGPGLLWVYGSGFPKSLDVSKAIDKAAGAEREVVGKSGRHIAAGDAAASNLYAQDEWTRANGRMGEFITAPATEDAARWSGWGTALKPAWEPIVVARKPLAGTVAGNVTEHGTGALNVDGCRVESASERPARARVKGVSRRNEGDTFGQAVHSGVSIGTTSAGRWPPNVLLGPEAAAELDRQSGVLTSGANPSRRGSDKFRDAYGEFAGQQDCTPARGADAGGASRFFPVFRYEAKAPASERPRGDDGTAHPTVKPVDLMAWLVRLVTPPGGLVADPFAGSGATAEACIIEGFRCVLIEKDPAYAALIRKRLRKDIQPAMFGS